jgi:hypothetical protein
MKKIAVLICCIMMLGAAAVCFADDPAPKESITVSPQLNQPYPYTPDSTVQNGDNSAVTQKLIDEGIIPLATDQIIQKESAATTLPNSN